MAGDEAGKKAVDPEEAINERVDLSTEDAPAEAGADEAQQRIDEAVEAALAEQRDALLRAQAEVVNMRRRCEQDVEKAHKFALERFAGDLLPVVDNLERALDSKPESQDEGLQAVFEGVELTYKSFLDTLLRHKVEQIDPQGEPFDPQAHEAMVTQPSDQVEPNTVLTVVQKGYLLNGRVIRPARVIVSKAGA